MTVDQGLRAHVLGDTAITAAVGARMYPLRLQEKQVFPAIVYIKVDEVREQHLRGPGGLTSTRFQIDAWHRGIDGAVALGELIRKRLDGFQGDFHVAGSPGDQLYVQAVLFLVGREFFEEEILGGLGRHSADYRVIYRS